MSERKHELLVPLEGSPEAVWQAISNPAEIVKWFTSGARIESGPDGTPAHGKLWLTWGDGPEAPNDILEWEPGKRMVVGFGGKVIEFVVEATEGQTTLRLVHSGFDTDAKFDDEYEATYGGWSTYFAVLRYVMANKAGQDVVSVTVTTAIEKPGTELRPLMSDGAAVLGMPVREIARPKAGYLVVVVPELDDSPVSVCCEGFGGTCYVTISAYLFGEGKKRAEEIRQRAKSFFDGIK